MNTKKIKLTKEQMVNAVKANAEKPWEEVGVSRSSWFNELKRNGIAMAELRSADSAYIIADVSAVYKIVNTVTKDFYVGSSKNVKKRWTEHKSPSVWKKHPNNPLYQDMQKYGVENFRFQILAPVMEEYLTQVEQEFIDLLYPTYNSKNAKGLDIERIKETNIRCNREYRQSNKGKEVQRKWRQSDKGKKYFQSDKYKDYMNNYNSQMCYYNGELIRLHTLAERFRRAGVEHSHIEAKKYLLNQ